MLSVGVESLSDRLLELIGRSHDAAAAKDAVRRAIRHGFDAVNTDFMFALPTQTLRSLTMTFNARWPWEPIKSRPTRFLVSLIPNGDNSCT